MSDIYKEIGKIFTKDAEYKYRGYILSKRGGSSSATAVATEELIKKAEEKGLKIKTRLIGPRNFPIKDMKNMVDRELLAVGLNQEFTKDSKFKMEISPKAIENLSDNGFSGIAIVKNNKGEVVKRKGFSGATAEQVKRLANEWFKENKIFTNDSNKYDEWINYSEKNLTRVKDAMPANLKKDKYVATKAKADAEMNRMIGNRDQFKIEREGVAGFVYKFRANGKIAGYYNDMSGDLYYDPKVMAFDSKPKVKDSKKLEEENLMDNLYKELGKVFTKDVSIDVNPYPGTKKQCLDIEKQIKGFGLSSEAKGSVSGEKFRDGTVMVDAYIRNTNGLTAEDKKKLKSNGFSLSTNKAYFSRRYRFAGKQNYGGDYYD